MSERSGHRGKSLEPKIPKTRTFRDKRYATVATIAYVTLLVLTISLSILFLIS